jgi:cytochrome c553
MHQIAKGYTDEQIKLVAGYFAAQQREEVRTPHEHSNFH